MNHKLIAEYLKQIDLAENEHSPWRRSDYADGLVDILRDIFTDDELIELAQAKAEGRLVVLRETGIGDLSDGYHTFNELYHHRAILFSVICNEHPDISWKSKLHHDGTMFDGMFIVGINTPEGQATYHYDINPYWDMFRVRELEKAPEWDGHTSEQAIERIAGLTREAAEKAIPTCNVTKLPCAGCNPVCEHREE